MHSRHTLQVLRVSSNPVSGVRQRAAHYTEAVLELACDDRVSGARTPKLLHRQRLPEVFGRHKWAARGECYTLGEFSHTIIGNKRLAHAYMIISRTFRWPPLKLTITDLREYQLDLETPTITTRNRMFRCNLITPQ